MPIGPIEGTLPLIRPESLKEVTGPVQPIDAGVGEASEVSFGQVFADLVASANHQGHVAHRAYVSLAEGRSDDIHGTMIEGRKASIQMKLVGSIKNKVVDAFYEIWRMNI